MVRGQSSDVDIGTAKERARVGVERKATLVYWVPPVGTLATQLLIGPLVGSNSKWPRLQV